MNSYIILLNAVAASNATAKILYVTLDKTLARKQYAKKIASLTKKGGKVSSICLVKYFIWIYRRQYAEDTRMICFLLNKIT